MKTTGLFDLQVNGYAGVDFNDAALTPDAFDHALAAMLGAGTTHCLPTLITAPEDVLGARLTALDAAIRHSRLGPPMVPGIHLEGPFLNPAPGYAGCHPAASMVEPNPDVLARIAAHALTPVRLLTLAPELPGAVETIHWARARGMVVAMGHTAADLDTVRAAAAAGVRLSTHLGNALPQPVPKFLNPMMAQMAEDRLAASFIADGIHIPPHALGAMLRAKGLSRAILVSDATAAADSPPGLYPFAGMTVERADDGSVRVPGETILAGSGLRLDRAVRNIVAWGIAHASEAQAMASARPAALLGIERLDSEVEWDGRLMPVRVTVGGLTIGVSR